MSKIRVLSVDDSALMRQIMTEIINSHSDMEMVATAAGSVGRPGFNQKIQSRRPDAGRGNAAHGRPRLPGEVDAPASNACGDGFFTDR